MEEKQAEAAPAAPEEVSILYLTYTRPARNEAEQALYGGFQEANPGITLDIKIVDGGGTGVRQNIPILFAAGTRWVSSRTPGVPGCSSWMAI